MPEPQLPDSIVAPGETASPSSLGKLSLSSGDRKITDWDAALKILLAGIWTKLDSAQKWMAAIPTSAFYKKKSVLLLPLVPNSALMRARCHCTEAAFRPPLNANKLQVDRCSSEYVQTQNCWWQRCLQVKTRRSWVSSGTSMAAENVCLNFLLCPLI